MNNNIDDSLKPIEDRSFEEVEGGYYDDNGNYYTPNGSFWDDNGLYFNRHKFDKHGGTYDNFGVYIHGEGWNEEFGCYNSEMDKQITEEYKEIFNRNLNQALIEDYDYYERYFRSDIIDEEDSNDSFANESEKKTNFNSMSPKTTPRLRNINSNNKNDPNSNINSTSVFSENINTINFHNQNKGGDFNPFQ